MSGFGARLRTLRLRCVDPLTGRPLTQERLGGLLREEMGVGVSGAAVSDWERGESKIHADDRLLLVSLIHVLRARGGIQTLADANELLEAGNYRSLNSAETLQVFPDASAGARAASTFSSQRVGDLADTKEDWAALLDKAKEGPPPAWPRVVTALMRGASDRLSVFGFLRALLFFWLWIFTCELITPSLHWPFESRKNLFWAVSLYCAGTLILPALLGLFADTKNNKFWREVQLSNSLILRLYTHQGAFVGFHAGYFAVFLFILVLNFMRQPPAVWLVWILMLAPLVMGYVGAREVPYSLWRAYGQLRLRDGGIFFAFVLVGPFWGFFLFQFFSVLTSSLGLFMVLMAVTLLAGGMAWQSKEAQKLARSKKRAGSKTSR